jgi:DivIVA domain-containing protein
MKDSKISRKIYEKDFNTKALGYCCEEVDAFLDDINFDVEKLEREIETLKEKLHSSECRCAANEQKIKDLSRELYSQKAQNAVSSTSNGNFSNIELLNRIANLEKMVQSLIDNNKSKDGRF